MTKKTTPFIFIFLMSSTREKIARIGKEVLSVCGHRPLAEVSKFGLPNSLFSLFQDATQLLSRGN
jgi:hypothetical protein